MISSMESVIANLREFAPYALIELVLPGGSLMALLLWLHRRQKKVSGSPWPGESRVRCVRRRQMGESQAYERLKKEVQAGVRNSGAITYVP